MGTEPEVITCESKGTLALADLGGAWDTRPPGRPNSFDFMQFSGKFGVFTPPLEGSRPPLGKILDPPLTRLTRDTAPGPNFSHIHAVFGKKIAKYQVAALSPV